MNSMNDSAEFHEVESNHSGRLSYVSSQPAMITRSRSIPSRDKRLPWNTSGSQENVFGNQFSTFDSPRDHYQGVHPCAPQRERGSVPQATGSGTLFSSDDKQNRDTIPMPTFAGRASTMGSKIQVEIPQNSMVGQHRQQISELQFDIFQSFLVWKIRFKNQVTTCSDFSLEAMLWIKEVEMVDSLEESKSSRPVSGREGCFCSEQNHPEFTIPEEGQSRGTESRKKEDRFLRGRQIAFMIYNYHQVTGAPDTVLDYAHLFFVTLHDDNIQEFDARWDEVLLSMSTIPSDDVLESL